MNRTIIGHCDIAIGRNRQFLTLLGIAIYINYELIARTQYIVLRRGNVHHRLESKGLVVEDIAAEHTLTCRCQ